MNDLLCTIAILNTITRFYNPLIGSLCLCADHTQLVGQQKEQFAHTLTLHRVHQGAGAGPKDSMCPEQYNHEVAAGLMCADGERFALHHCHFE